MIIEGIIVAVLSWIVQKILDSINNDIEKINTNYYKTENSYEIIINNYSRVINTYNWNDLWESKNIIKREHNNQWEYYKEMLSVQNRLHKSKQKLYDKIKLSD